MDRRPSPAPATAAQGDAGAQARRQAFRDQVAAETGIDEAMIERLVRAFYARVREDLLLAPIFGARIVDWEPHLQQMFAFWSWVAHLAGAK